MHCHQLACPIQSCLFRSNQATTSLEWTRASIYETTTPYSSTAWLLFHHTHLSNIAILIPVHMDKSCRYTLVLRQT